MKIKSISIMLFIAVVTISLTGCAGARPTNVKKEPAPTPDWLLNWDRIDMSEADFRAYFDENAGKLDPVEGIWVLSDRTKWVNIVSGLKGTYGNSNLYTFAVIRDAADSTRFNIWVLKSKKDKWEPGMFKGFFTKTAMKNVYIQNWHMSDFSPEEKTVSIQKGAIIRYVESNSDYPINYEMETVKLKMYPPIGDSTEGSEEE